MHPLFRLAPSSQLSAAVFVGGKKFASGSAYCLLSALFESAGTTLGTCGEDSHRPRKQRGAKWRLYGT